MLRNLQSKHHPISVLHFKNYEALSHTNKLDNTGLIKLNHVYSTY